MATTYTILQKVIKYYPSASHIYVTSTTGGRHSTKSLHYLRQAIDVGSRSQAYKDGLAAWLYKYSRYFTELIHTRAGGKSGWYVKNGVRRSNGFYGRTLNLAHINHVHAGIRSVAQANALLAAVKRDAAKRVPQTLKAGAKGVLVVALQRALNRRGINPKVTVDGTFGPQTLRMVKAFQKSHKLKPDGIVGPAMWKALK